MDLVTLEKLPYLCSRRDFNCTSVSLADFHEPFPSLALRSMAYHVPEGTTVSMSSWIVHPKEDLFPNTEKLDPTRWQDPAPHSALERHLFSSGKGPRQCVGMQLAYAELYVTLSRVFRQLDDLKTSKKAREGLLYNDYFSSYHPEAYNKFVFERAR